MGRAQGGTLESSYLLSRQRALYQAAVSFVAVGEEGWAGVVELGAAEFAAAAGWAVAAGWVAESVLELGDAGALTGPDPRGKIPAPCRCKVFAT